MDRTEKKSEPMPYAVYMLTQKDILGPADWIGISATRVYLKEYEWNGEQYLEEVQLLENTMLLDRGVREAFDFQLFCEEMERIDEKLLSWAR